MGRARDASANFDMQSLKSLQHGDRILVKRADHSVYLSAPQGLELLLDTLRKNWAGTREVLTMALKRIVLRDFARIVQYWISDWQTGFTVLTGETGAGKIHQRLGRSATGPGRTSRRRRAAEAAQADILRRVHRLPAPSS